MTKFVPLHVHSHYSMLDGLAKIDELILKAKDMGCPAIALTDHGNLHGALEFYKKSKEHGIKPILGLEAYVAPGKREDKNGNSERKYYHLTLLAKNNKGWENLIKLSTKGYMEGFYYKPRIDKELIEEHSEGIICLSGCASGEVAKAIENNNYEKAKKVATWYKNIFKDDYYLELQPHTPTLHEKTKRLSSELGIPLVATQDTHYVNKEDADAHDVLLAIQTRNTIYDTKRMTLKEFDLSLRSGEEMMKEFKDIPEAVENTLKIAEKCDVIIELEKDRLPNFPLPEGETSESFLRRKIKENIDDKYQDITQEIKERVEYELDVITKLGFANYFLIVHDIVSWSKNRGIVVGPGRGSAAGSIVSYILGITNVDPIKYDLLFERFLNPERNEMPDIDIDFADVRRDEVIAYTREKYGFKHVAQIITFGKMLARAAIRDVGRALGLSYGICDKMAKLIPFNTSIEEALENVEEMKAEYESNEDIKKLIDYAIKLEGVARHASVHACGVVISPAPLTNFIPLQLAPQGDNTVITQFEMKAVEDLGLLKMDFLGLRNLTIIEEALQLIKEDHGKDIDIESIDLDDEKTYKLLQSGKSVGVFQLEANHMRPILKDLKPTEFEDIVALISLNRPGPIEYIPTYIKRNFGKEKPTYLHPKLEPILSTTYGIGIYQEQMMRIARDLAGFSFSEADILRKAIGKKIEKLLAEQKTKLIDGMVNNGIDERTAEKIWDLFPPFARYGFNRSHAASYAMISYQTAYLKAHYPVEFMTALLNTAASDVDRIDFFVREANDLGIEVLPPDINESGEGFTVTSDGKDIRFGLLAIKNMGQNIVKAIIEERTNGGNFKDIADMLSRVNHRDLNKKSIEALVKCGALELIGPKREIVLANIEEMIKFAQASRKMAEDNQGLLFGENDNGTLRFRENEDIETDVSQRARWEKELLGLYLTEHPFSKYAEKIRKKVKSISDIISENSKTKKTNYCNIAGIVSKVDAITTRKGDPMLFVTIEDDTDNMEIMVFKDQIRENREAWEDGRIIVINGRLSYRDEKPKMICNKVKVLK